jgi:hypothetical protein
MEGFSMPTKRSKTLIAAPLVIVLAILACTPGPVPTGAPTQPPAGPTEIPPTLEPTVPPAQQWFTEEFDTDTGNWSQVVEKNSNEGDPDLAKVSVADGSLHFDLDKQLIAYRLYDPYEYTDVRIDARVDNRGTNVNDVLLICRASDEGLYLVNIANSGLFAMYAYDGKTKVYSRIADGGSNKIKPGKEVNDYSLVCKDNKLTLYINDNKTRDYTDNRFGFRSGKIGVGIASEGQLPVIVDFESVKISEP